MTQTIQWQRGTYLKFTANQTIRVGGKDLVTLPQDEEFEYDGTVLRYAGMEVHTPQLRSGIGNDWATLQGRQAARAAVVRPSRAIAKATSVNRDLNRVQRVQQNLEQDDLDENTVMDVSARGSAEMKNSRGQLVGHLDHKSRPGQRVMNVSASDMDQEGVVISRIRTPANLGKVDVTQKSHLASQLENISADQGFGRVPKSVQSGGISSRLSVGSSESIGDEHDGRVVGRVRDSARAEREARAAATVRHAAAKKPAAKKAAAKKAAPAAKKPTAKKEDLSLLSPRVRTAVRMDPGFPRDWNFEGKLVDRLDRVKKHGASPEFLDALWAAEGDQMRRALEKAYPKHFGG